MKRNGIIPAKTGITPIAEPFSLVHVA